MSKSRRKELDKVQFTKLIVNIQKDIERLFERYYECGIELEVPTNFKLALDAYIASPHSLSDYMIFRGKAIQIHSQTVYKINSPDRKQIVCNIVLGILGLGVIYGLAVGINYLLNDKALFFKPEAVNRIDAVINDIEALQNNVWAATI